MRQTPPTVNAAAPMGACPAGVPHQQRADHAGIQKGYPALAHGVALANRRAFAARSMEAVE